MQSSFAICALTSVMLVLRNVKGTMLITARDVHKHAAAVLKNVEGWQDRLGKDHPLFSLRLF
jgi:hypothetical protein